MCKFRNALVVKHQGDRHKVRTDERGAMGITVQRPMHGVGDERREVVERGTGACLQVG